MKIVRIILFVVGILAGLSSSLCLADTILVSANESSMVDFTYTVKAAILEIWEQLESASVKVVMADHGKLVEMPTKERFYTWGGAPLASNEHIEEENQQAEKKYPGRIIYISAGFLHQYRYNQTRLLITPSKSYSKRGFVEIGEEWKPHLGDQWLTSDNSKEVIAAIEKLLAR